MVSDQIILLLSYMPFFGVNNPGSTQMYSCIAFEILFFYNNRFVLTFRRPCFVIYSYNKSQRDALFLKFILIKYCTYFGQIYCP